MKCYFDGSEGVDDSNHKWLTLAGYGAPDTVWADFETKWKEMLKARYPVAFYIHINELMGWDDPFERANGWDEDKKSALVFDAIQLLQALDKSRFTSYVCSVDLTAYEELKAVGHLISDPHKICAELCFGKSVSWYNDQHPLKPELAYVFFDRGEKFIDALKEQWLRERTPRGRVTVNPAWDLIENITDVDMRDYPAMQAADMIAWGRSRQLSEIARPYRHLLDIIQKIVPSWTYKIDEAVLRSKNPIVGLTCLDSFNQS